MFFINKVLLPLIKNENTVPICLVDQTTSQDWNINIDSSDSSADSKSKGQDYSQFLPSGLIDNDIRQNLVKAFKEIVGKISTS